MGLKAEIFSFFGDFIGVLFHWLASDPIAQGRTSAKLWGIAAVALTREQSRYGFEARLF